MSITESTFLVSNAIAKRLADIQFDLADFSRYASGYISFDGAQECQERLTAIIDGVRQCREDLQQETAAPPSTAAARIYISGPMTGLPDLNFPAFHAAAAALRAKGIDVVNPAELNADNQGDWASCMKADIKALCDCTALALLPGWEDSSGAHLEMHLAHRLGMKVRKIEEFIECSQ